jgi:hypothetical protein
LRIEELEGCAVAAVDTKQKFRQAELAREGKSVGLIPEFDLREKA